MRDRTVNSVQNILYCCLLSWNLTKEQTIKLTNSLTHSLQSG